MRSLFAFTMAGLLAMSACVPVAIADDATDAYESCLRELHSVFTDSDTEVGKTGIKVTCTVMPDREVATIGWKIENPRGEQLAIRTTDVRLYSGAREFERVPADEAIEMMDTWVKQEKSRSTRRDIFEDMRQRPGEEKKDDCLAKSAFAFGVRSEPVIAGLTFFECRMNNLSDVTAEITINGEKFSFEFDGGGP